jgi:tRNA G18 (ribose-2'-O)-methylase SpoU
MPGFAAMKRTPITLVGDGIENPGNALTMIHAAAMFGSDCVFRDRGGLAGTWPGPPAGETTLSLISPDDLSARYSPVVALDNLDGAAMLHGFRINGGPRPAVVAGNERTGISREIHSKASAAVQIPMVSRRLNCLNVAAASAVALYYLSRGGEGKLQSRGSPEQRRPEVMLVGGADPIELGSAIRSAGAFGWERLLVEDRAGVWFGGNRVTQSESRAAARRQRNPIHLIPTEAGRHFPFEEAWVVTTRQTDTSIHRANLARGPRQLIVLPDESALELEREDWERLAKVVKFVHLDLPCGEFRYHYRLIASIALAEVARQVGQKSRPDSDRARRPGPLYDRSLKLLMEEKGDVVYLEDLDCY